MSLLGITSPLHHHYIISKRHVCGPYLSHSVAYDDCLVFFPVGVHLRSRLLHILPIRQVIDYNNTTAWKVLIHRGRGRNSGGGGAGGLVES